MLPKLKCGYTGYANVQLCIAVCEYYGYNKNFQMVNIITSSKI